MKKYILVGMMVFVLVSSAMATVSINWVWDQQALQGVVQQDGVTPLPGNSIVQLIWSPDATLGPLNDLDPLTPTGGDILLATAGSTAGGYWNFGAANYGTAGTYVGGYAFQRVFDVTLGNTPGPGDWYGDGTFVSAALADADGAPTPPADPSYLFSSSGSPFVVNMAIIPEPTTFVMALIGCVPFIVRFVRRRK